MGQNGTHLQILYRGDLLVIGHWVCIYYDTKILRIYDSLQYKDFPPLQEAFISNLFPFHPPIQYVDVQRQNDNFDCGVFAVAYATGIALNRNPASENYLIPEMRRHLLTMLHNSYLPRFPSAYRRPRGQKQKNIFPSIVSLKRLKENHSTPALTSSPVVNSADLEEGNQSSNKSIVKSRKDHDTFQRKENNLKRKRMSRTRKDVADKEREKDQIRKRNIRLTRYRKQELLRDRTARRIARSQTDYRENERNRDSQTKRETRKRVSYRILERNRDAHAHREARKIDELKSKERARDRSARRTVRFKQKNRKEERLRDKMARKVKRDVNEVREIEKTRDFKARRKIRENPEIII